MSVERRDLVAGALLIASLVTNALLFHRWRGGNAQAPTTSAAAAGALADAWRQPLPGLRQANPPVALDACQARTAGLRLQIAELDRLRDRHTPPGLRFEQGAQNGALTATLAAEVARHLPPALRASIAIDCRGRLCRLAVPKGARDAAWLASFRESEWVGQNLHELDGDGDGLLFEQHPPGAVRSSDLLQQALQDFESSGAIEECQKRFRDEGTLDAQVSLEPSDDRDDTGIVVTAGGRLAGTALGNCIDGEFRRALTAITLPPRFDRAALSAQFPRP